MLLLRVGQTWRLALGRRFKSTASSSAAPVAEKVRIVEVGPRDGLQNESTLLSIDVKLELIRRLAACGLDTIEAASFVSPKWIPQMASSREIMAHVTDPMNKALYQPGKSAVRYPVLTPNLKGYDAAVASGAREVSIFGAASESFSKRNINCSIAESLDRFKAVCQRAREDGLLVRGYVSCVVGCPYEGRVDPDVVSRVTEQMLEMGCAEVSLGDTIGVGTAGSIYQMLRAVKRVAAVERLAIHCHDTYGQALANILVSLQEGVRVVDSSIGGLGGCPYARGASGNVATEDVVYMLQGMHDQFELSTSNGGGSLDLSKLVDTGNWISAQLSRRSSSKVGLAMSAAGSRAM